MPNYAILGGYTAGAWAKLVENPIDRPAICEAIESVGVKLENVYWTFGEDDFLVIVDAPDDVKAAAAAEGLASTGVVRNPRTIRLTTADEVRKILEKAEDRSFLKSVRERPPGQVSVASR